MDRYTMESKIGGGAYGDVFKGIDSRSGDVVAIKKIRVDNADDGIPATTLREMVLLKRLKHDNVVTLRDIIMEPGKYFLVFEMMDGDLYYLMRNSTGPLAEDLIQSYTSQFLDGLAYCHSMGVMHRDLKPQNLLVSKDGAIKIADFGLSRAFSYITLTVEVVTPWYRPPELLLGSNSYSLAVDVWSAGCIIAEMGRRKVMFEGAHDIDQIHLIFHLLGTPNEESWVGIGQCPYWRDSFPKWPRSADWGKLIPHIPDEGRQLIECVNFAKLPYKHGVSLLYNWNAKVKEFQKKQDKTALKIER